MRRLLRFMEDSAYGFVLGFVFVLASVLGSHGCSTVTAPPPSWPPGTSCAEDSSGPGCYGPLHDRRATTQVTSEGTPRPGDGGR